MPKSKQNGDHTESSTSPEDPLPHLASDLEEKIFSPHLPHSPAQADLCQPQQHLPTTHSGKSNGHVRPLVPV